VAVAVTLVEPEVAWVPLHAPDAVQLVASVDDQVSVLLAPAATVAGLALMDTVGAGVTTTGGVAPLPEEPPPQAASASRQAASAARNGNARIVFGCMVKWAQSVMQ